MIYLIYEVNCRFLSILLHKYLISIFFTSFIEEIIIWLYFFVCSCSQKSNISNLPTASLCCAGSITYKCIGKIQNMKVYLYRPQFENVHFLWVNNASTSFFTHFYSINFIYTAYFAWNYFIFTSYMKYFRLWSFSIVTALLPTTGAVKRLNRTSQNFTASYYGLLCVQKTN